MADPSEPGAPSEQGRHFKTPEERAQLVAINREIALCANRKDLSGAIAAFQRAKSAGWANSHTYSAMINTHVRCGDIEGAVAVFDRLKASRLKLDVVSCTTMIKGYCSVGDIGGGVALLHEMKRRNLAVNIRTINTVIRGCLATGTNRIGHNVFSCMKSVFGVQPDSSSWEYEVFMLCQGLQLDRVLPMIGRLGGEGGDMTHSMSAIYGAVAKAAALRGEWALARKNMRLCHEAIAAETKAPPPAPAQDDEEEEGEEGGDRARPGKQAAVGGKRAWKEMDESREQSLTMYREHKRAELRQEMQLLESYVLAASAGGPSADISFFERVLSFDPFNGGLLRPGAAAAEHLPLLLLKNLIEKFGLDCFIQRQLRLPVPPSKKNSDILSAVFQLDDIDSVLFVDPAAQAGKRGKNKKLKGKQQADSAEAAEAVVAPIGSVESILAPPADGGDGAGAEAILRGVGRRLCACLAEDGTIDFSAVFADPARAATGPGRLPLKMEICSGSGEWAAQQARHEAGSANWVSLEVKQDRVYQTFLRMVFQNVRNLCAISGDAVQLLPRHVGSASVDSIFINHPEPPVQYGGSDHKRQKVGGEAGAEAWKGDAFGKHLLTLPFFAELERVLVPGGTITLVTDNLWYGKLILRSLSTLPHPRGMQSVALPTGQSDTGERGQYAVQEELSGYVLYRGRPGKDCGHTSEEASSYFDRLWNRDNQPERYFFVFQKVDTSIGLSLRIAPKGNMSRMKNVPENFNATKTFAVVKTGTKIKFDD